MSLLTIKGWEDFQVRVIRVDWTTEISPSTLREKWTTMRAKDSDFRTQGLAFSVVKQTEEFWEAMGEVIAGDEELESIQ